MTHESSCASAALARARDTSPRMNIPRNELKGVVPWSGPWHGHGLENGGTSIWHWRGMDLRRMGGRRFGLGVALAWRIDVAMAWRMRGRRCGLGVALAWRRRVALVWRMRGR